MSHKLVTVIVPVYNSEKYLERCLDSVINQTYKDLEIILVNDGSTDRSSIICERFSQLDDRIIIVNKENGGQASARNRGLEIAKGDFIGFVDSDDWIELEMYEKLVASIEGHDLCVCGRFNINEISGSKTEVFSSNNPVELNQEELIRRFLLTDKIDGSPCDKLFKKQLIGKTRFPEGYICEDLPFVFNVLLRCRSAIQIGVPLYNYLQRKGSTSKSVYSSKTFGLLKYSRDIYDLACEYYPGLKKEASVFYCNRMFAFYEMYELAGGKKPRPGKMPWATLRYLSLKKRIKFILIKLHLYRFVRNISKPRT